MKLFFLLLVSLPTFAAQRPTMPPAAEDLALTQGLSAKDFFAARAQDKECVRELEATLALYQNLKKQLSQLKQQGAAAATLDAKQDEMREAKKVHLAYVKTCGPCATQSIHKEVIRTEYWYVTDGSCFIDPKDEATGLANFERAVSFLLNTGHYSKQNGGLTSILEFLLVDPKTGAILPHVAQVPVASPITTFIAVRGPVGYAFNYLFENRFELKSGDFKEFVIRFQTVKKPEGFVTPTVYDITAGGTKNATRPWNLNRVHGMWYITSRGYLRYHTAADFELNVPSFVGNAALPTLLETLFDLSERSVGE